MDDWGIDFSQPAPTNVPVQPQEVILKFKSSSGIAPKGTVKVMLPAKMGEANPSYYYQEIEITNGQAQVRSFVGAQFEYAPAQTIGYWFKENSIAALTNGSGPLVIDVPVIPAGAICASAKNADGTPAGGLFFGVEELKRSPLRDALAPLSDNSDTISGNVPRKWVSGPLPLGGTYQIYGWRGNSFCVSKPVALTESEPDAVLELQFPPARSFTGEVRDAGGQPLRDASIGLEFVLAGSHSFGLKPVYTDDNGQFRVDDTTPDAGKYVVTISAPGCQSERVDADFSRLPEKWQLKRGLALAGRVVEAGTGNVIPDAEVRAWTTDTHLPSQTTRTDADGRFEFDTLGQATYSLFVNGANFQPDATDGFAAGRTNLLLKVTPYPGSQLKPKAPGETNAAAVSLQKDNNPTVAANAVEGKIEAAKLVQDGKLLYEMGKFDDAETKLKAAIALNPTNPAANYYLDLVEQSRWAPKSQGPMIVYPALDSSRTNAHSQPTNLEMRIFKVDTNTLRKLPGVQTNNLATMVESLKSLFSKLGVDLTAPGRSLAYGDKLGLLFVKATPSELDTIEHVVQALNQVPPEIHIKARFTEVPESDVGSVLKAGVAVDAKETNTVEILTATNATMLLRQLESAGGVTALAEPEAETTSGRQIQMRSDNSTVDLHPWLLSDGYTFNLQATVSKPETMNALANVWDGQTLALVSSKSNGTNRLIVFVTATVVDSAGKPVHSDDELPFNPATIPPQPH